MGWMVGMKREQQQADQSMKNFMFTVNIAARLYTHACRISTSQNHLLKAAHHKFLLIWLLSMAFVTHAWAADKPRDHQDDPPLIMTQPSEPPRRPSKPTTHASSSASAVIAGALFYQSSPHLYVAERWWLKVIEKIPSRIKKWLLPATVVGVGGGYVAAHVLKATQSISGEGEEYSFEGLDESLLPSSETLESSSEPPDFDPSLVMLASLKYEQRERERISDQVFEESLDKEDNQLEMEILQKMLSHQFDADVFLSNPEAHRLLSWPSLITSDEIKQRIRNIKNDQGTAMFSEQAVQLWDRRHLYNFLSHGIHHSLETHIFLGLIMGGGEFRTIEIAQYYKVDPDDVIMAKSKIIKRMNQFYRQIQQAPTKLSHRASSAEIERAILALDPMIIRTMLDKQMVELGLPPLPVYQRRFFKNRHLLRFYQQWLLYRHPTNKELRKERGILAQRFLQEVLQIQRVNPNNPNDKASYEVSFSELRRTPFHVMVRSRRIEIFRQLDQYFKSENIFLPVKITQHSGALSEQAESYSAELSQAYLLLSEDDVALLGQKHLGLQKLQKDHLEKFLDILSAYPVMPPLFLSQVLGVEKTSEMAFSQLFDLSVSNIRYYAHKLRHVFLNFIDIPHSPQRATPAKSQKNSYRMLSESELQDEFAQMSASQVLKNLTRFHGWTSHTQAVDQFVSNRAYRRFIHDMMSQPSHMRIFLSHILQLDETDLPSIAQMFEMSPAELDERVNQVKDRVHSFLSSQLPSVTASESAVLTQPSQSFLGDLPSTALLDQLDELMERLRQADQDSWSWVSARLGSQPWFMADVPHFVKDMKFSKKHFELLDHEVLTTPLRKYLFLVSLLGGHHQIQVLSGNEIARQFGVLRAQQPAKSIYVQAQIVHLLLTGEVSSYLDGDQSVKYMKYHYQVITDRLAWQTVSDRFVTDRVVLQIRRVFGDSSAMSDISPPEFRKLLTESEQNIFGDNLRFWMIYLYDVLGFKLGELTAHLSPGHDRSLQDTDIDALLRQKRNIFVPVLSHQIQDERKTINEQFSEMVTSSYNQSIGMADLESKSASMPSHVHEWYENLGMSELIDRLSRWYGRVNDMVWVDPSVSVSEVMNYIETLPTDFAWQVFGGAILGYENIDMAQLRHHPGFHDQLSQIESSLFEILLPHSGVSSIELTEPTSLLEYSKRDLEKSLRQSLNDPSYVMNPAKIVLFEKYYLRSSKVLWQIYMWLAGYKANFKGVTPFYKLPERLKDHLIQNTKTALKIAADGSDRIYLVDHVTAFHYLRYPESFKMDLSYDQLLNYESTISELSLISHLTSVISLDDPQGFVTTSHTFGFGGKFLISQNHIHNYKDLINYIHHVVRADPLRHHIFLAKIAGLTNASDDDIAQEHQVARQMVQDITAEITHEIYEHLVVHQPLFPPEFPSEVDE